MDIKFVSYDGCFPNLCMGNLVLEIDNTLYTFGTFTDKEKENCFDSFWETGGYVSFDEDWNDYVFSGPWKLSSRSLPDFLKPYGKELIEIFNENVPYGCCGGCV